MRQSDRRFLFIDGSMRCAPVSAEFLRGSIFIGYVVGVLSIVGHCLSGFAQIPSVSSLWIDHWTCGWNFLLWWELLAGATWFVSYSPISLGVACYLALVGVFYFIKLWLLVIVIRYVQLYFSFILFSPKFPFLPFLIMLVDPAHIIFDIPTWVALSSRIFILVKLSPTLVVHSFVSADNLCSVRHSNDNHLDSLEDASHQPFRAGRFDNSGDANDDDVLDGFTPSLLRSLPSEGSVAASTTVTHYINKFRLFSDIRWFAAMHQGGHRLHFVHFRFGARQDTALGA